MNHFSRSDDCTEETKVTENDMINSRFSKRLNIVLILHANYLICQ